MSNVEMYFDGSGNTSNSSLKFFTLSGFVSHAHVWRSFELRWKAVLYEYQIAHFHMTDAYARRKLFKDWEREKIDKLLSCLLSVVGEYHQKDFECYSCIVALEDYRKAKIKIESNGYKLRSPESICVNACAGRIPFPEGCTGIKLYFDRNEKFMHKINRNWEKMRKQGTGWARQIESIEPIDSSRPGIQAADIFAWWSRRYYENPDHPKNKFFDGLSIIAGHFCEYFDYKMILSSYPIG